MLNALVVAAAIANAPVSAHRAVSTTSPSAQAHFDRGLTDLYAYAGGDASTEFHAALADDPHLAIASWGIALAEGSDLNTPLTELRFQRAHDAATQALANRAYASERERALIETVAQRYSGTYAQSQADERAYREAMDRYVKANADDDDAAMLYVEAQMEDHGMDWQENGAPMGGVSAQMLDLVNGVLSRNPAHMMANHLCIHLHDNAPDRTPAVACAQRLDALTFAPNNEHLAHMPAHTWLERGQWREAMASSERAYQLTATWATQTGQDITASHYGRHDEYLGLSSAVMGGDREGAQRWVTRLDAYGMGTYDAIVAARFGEWQTALQADIAHGAHGILARGLAEVATGDLAAARRDLALVQHAALAPDDDLLQARIDEHDGRTDQALAALRRAARWEHDNLAPEMISLFPADELIGGALYRAGRYAQAERAFGEAVTHRPFDPRLLYGWWQSQLRVGDAAATTTQSRYRDAWGGPQPLSMDMI